MWHYARGLAQSGRHDFGAAQEELSKLEAEASGLKDDMIVKKQTKKEGDNSNKS